MLERKILDQYCWILRVLDSCMNSDQIQTTQNLFDNFIKTNQDRMSNSNKDTFIKTFNCEKKSKLASFISKKRSKCIFSGVSKLFLF